LRKRRCWHRNETDHDEQQAQAPRYLWKLFQLNSLASAMPVCTSAILHAHKTAHEAPAEVIPTAC
jgi:hypothetical protein